MFQRNTVTSSNLTFHSKIISMAKHVDVEKHANKKNNIRS